MTLIYADQHQLRTSAHSIGFHDDEKNQLFWKFDLHFEQRENGRTGEKTESGQQMKAIFPMVRCKTSTVMRTPID